MESYSDNPAKRTTEIRPEVLQPAPSVMHDPKPVDHEVIWGTLALGMFAVAALPKPMISGAPIFFCPFRTMTGLPCPLCGGTHAMQALVRGQWESAWHYNPLAVAIGIAGASYLIYAIIAVATNRRWRPRIESPRRLTAGLALVAVLSGAANWAWLIHLARAGLWE